MELFEACKEKDYKKVKKLIKNGIDINYVDNLHQFNYGRNALLYVCGCYKSTDDSFKILKYLIKKGININHTSNYNNNALNYLISYSYTRNQPFKYLLKKGININNINDDNYTIINLAIYYKYYPILKLILKYSIKMHFKAKNNNIKEIDDIIVIKLLIRYDRINDFIINCNIDDLKNKRCNIITKYMSFKEIHLKKLIMNYIN